MVAAAPPAGCDPCSVLLSRGQAAGCSIFCGQLVHWLLPEVACCEYTAFRRTRLTNTTLTLPYGPHFHSCNQPQSFTHS